MKYKPFRTRRTLVVMERTKMRRIVLGELRVEQKQFYCEVGAVVENMGHGRKCW